jgi:hypothetical protein
VVKRRSRRSVAFEGRLNRVFILGNDRLESARRTRKTDGIPLFIRDENNTSLFDSVYVVPLHVPVVLGRGK